MTCYFLNLHKQSYTTATPLHLVNRKDPADQENRTNSLVAGRRSSDKDRFDLYDRWLSLSPRERQVTYLACQGCKNAEIAFQMGISVGTVKSYLGHVYFKIDVRSKAELRLKFHNFDFNSNPPKFFRCWCTATDPSTRLDAVFTYIREH